MGGGMDAKSCCGEERGHAPDCRNAPRPKPAAKAGQKLWVQCDPQMNTEDREFWAGMFTPGKVYEAVWEDEELLTVLEDDSGERVLDLLLDDPLIEVPMPAPTSEGVPEHVYRELYELQEDYDTLNLDYGRLATELERLKSRDTVLLTEKGWTKLVHYRRRIKELERKNEGLEYQLKSRPARGDVLDYEIKQLREEIRAQEKENLKLGEEVTELNAENVELRKLTASANNSRDALSERCRELEADLHSSLNHKSCHELLADVNGRLTTAMIERDQWAQKWDDDCWELKKLRDEVAMLKEMLKPKFPKPLVPGVFAAIPPSDPEADARIDALVVAQPTKPVCRKCGGTGEVFGGHYDSSSYTCPCQKDTTDTAASKYEGLPETQKEEVDDGLPF